MRRLFHTNSTPVSDEQLRHDRARRFGDGAVSAFQGFAAAAVGDRGRRDGIDVSRYQKVVDWRAVKAARCTWAATKATQGTAWIDPTFATNRVGMASAGFRHRGLYHWLSPVGMLLRASKSARLASACKQAEHFLATIGQLKPGQFALLDAEEEGITEDMVVEWCRVVEAATGRPCAVYTGVYVAGGTIWKSAAVFNGKRPRVLAAYTTEARARKLSGGWHAWQWTGSGTIAGVTTLVDIDQVDDHAIFDRICGLTDVQPEPQEDIMYVCINLTDAAAVFIGQRDGKGRIYQVEWSGPGGDELTRQRLTFLDETVTMDVAGLRLATLIGPLPYGDDRHVWTGAEFARVVQ